MFGELLVIPLKVLFIMTLTAFFFIVFYFHDQWLQPWLSKWLTYNLVENNSEFDPDLTCTNLNSKLYKMSVTVADIWIQDYNEVNVLYTSVLP
jgi:hypothetical protein